jgi:hypothetical protein
MRGGVAKSWVHSLRAFIDGLSFPTRVLVVILVAIVTIALMFDAELPTWEMSRLLPWAE